MSATITELETEAVKERKEVTKILAELIEAEKEGKLEKVMVCYREPGGEYIWRVSGNTTLAEYAFMTSLFQSDLLALLQKRMPSTRDSNELP